MRTRLAAVKTHDLPFLIDHLEHCPFAFLSLKSRWIIIQRAGRTSFNAYIAVVTKTIFILFVRSQIYVCNHSAKPENIAVMRIGKQIIFADDA